MERHCKATVRVGIVKLQRDGAQANLKLPNPNNLYWLSYVAKLYHLVPVPLHSSNTDT